MTARPSRAVLVVALGAVLLAVGAALVVLSRDAVVSVGWFDYTPLDSATNALPRHGVLVLSPGRVWGLVLAGTGALAVTAALGYLAGRRGAAAPPDPR